MKKEADLLVSTGLAAAGYEYVIVDGTCFCAPDTFVPQKAECSKRLQLSFTSWQRPKLSLSHFF